MKPKAKGRKETTHEIEKIKKDYISELGHSFKVEVWFGSVFLIERKSHIS